MEKRQYIGVLAIVWVMAIFVLQRWLSTILSFDVACGGLLLYLMIMSAIKTSFRSNISTPIENGIYETL